MDQDVTLTRQAFSARLAMENPDALVGVEDLLINIDILDKDGLPANDLFVIGAPTLNGLSGVNGDRRAA